MYLSRGDPRRIAVLAVLIGAAAAWAWARADEGTTDLLRFASGVGAGLVVAGLMRSADGELARRVPFERREAMVRVAITAAAALGPVVLLVASGADLAGGVDILLLGAAAGMLAGLGVLYPLDE